MPNAEKPTRAIAAVDGSRELAETLAELMLYEGYRTMREFTLRTFEFRYPELKSLVDYELKDKQGRPRSIKR